MRFAILKVFGRVIFFFCEEKKDEKKKDKKDERRKTDDDVDIKKVSRNRNNHIPSPQFFSVSVNNTSRSKLLLFEIESRATTASQLSPKCPLLFSALEGR
jgi:hypothetical protein|tara:strand:- start:132 stop:431 length:300 start_codon:yes stop_codon:yes gene_type:complete